MVWVWFHIAKIVTFVDFFHLTHVHTALVIGFKEASYSIGEGEGYFSFGIETKNHVTTAIPIDLTVTATDGEAFSKFS